MNVPSQGSSEARVSRVNRSEMVATLLDYDMPTAPYEGVALRLSVTADVAFLAIGTYNQQDGTIGTETFKFDDKGSSVGVDAELLYQTLGAMLRRADRENYDRLVEGTLPADHPSRREDHVTIPRAAVRVRA